MTLIQIKILDHIDRKLQHYKIDRDIATKAEVINEILDIYFKENPDFFLKKKGK